MSIDQVQVWDINEKKSEFTFFLASPKKILKILLNAHGWQTIVYYEPKEKWSHINNCRKEVQVPLIPNLLGHPVSAQNLSVMNRFTIVEYLVFLSKPFIYEVETFQGQVKCP